MALIDMNFVSMSLMREVSVKVILPTDYAAIYQPQVPYKTVYFLPGYSANAEQIVSYLGLRAQSELKGMAIVILNGENSFYVDVPERNGNYSTFVSSELVEFTRKIFPLSDKPEDTYLAGISMGGFGTLYNGIMHPEVFSKVAALSPAIDLYNIPELAGLAPSLIDHYFGNRESYGNSDADIKSSYIRDRKRPEIFLGCGRQDAAVWEQVKDFKDRLDAAGIVHTWMELDGNHDIYTWQTMLDSVFSFLAGIEPGTRDKMVI